VVLTPQWLVSSFVEVYPPDRVAMRQHPEGFPDAGKTLPKSVQNGCRGATIVAWLQHRVNI
jgi:hypothetical protein